MNNSLNLVLVGMLCSSLYGQTHFWDSIPKHSATLPVLFDQNTMNEIDQDVQNADTTDLIFIGNSITWQWTKGGQQGLNTWNQYYANRNSINAGISGDRTQGFLNRLSKGNLAFKKGVHPKVAVCMLGTNNIGWATNQNTVQETVDGIRAVMQLIIRRLPYTRILLVGIFPRDWGFNGTLLSGITEINNEIQKFADGKIVHYIDIGDDFIKPNGDIDETLMYDGLHPNAAGYLVWAQGIESKLVELLALPQLTPLRIMPLGNSITEGTSTLEAYRFHLDGILRRAGYDIDFVGGLNNHRNDNDIPTSYEFDIDHQGHWAREADWLLPRIRQYAENESPELVLLHIGTNDINHERNSTPEEVTDRTLLEIGSVIDSLRFVNPKIRVVLAQIIPTTANEIPNANNVIDLLNSKMVNFVTNKSTSESPVVLVDQNTGFNMNQDMSDPYHPNKAGAIKMAQKWLEGIGQVSDTTGNVFVDKVRSLLKPTKSVELLYVDNNFLNKLTLCENCSNIDVFDLSGKKILSMNRSNLIFIDKKFQGLAVLKRY